MSGAVYARTPNIGLGLLEFNFPNWADDANDNSSIIDGVMATIGVSVKGSWTNGIPYVSGDLVVDSEENVVYRCLINHTSALTGTFLQDRVAHPTYWQVASASLHARGQWVSGTTYYVNDIVYKDANQYSWALASRQYVSGTSYDNDVFGGNLVVITNTENVVNDATAAKNAAQTSATNAATSETNAAISASSASGSATNASTSAATATTQATAAAGSASSAGTSAVNAASSASAASVSANNAYISEGNASNSAAAASASLAAMLPDAPSDSKTYGRRNAIWQEVASTSLPEAPFTSIVYGRKDGTWVDAASGGSSVAATTFIGDGPPASPVVGQLWWESDTGNLFIYFNDGNSQQWVLATPVSGPPGQPGPPGGLGEAPTDGKTYARRSSAWVDDWASPTFTGDPKAPTPATSDNDTSIATTAFVKAQGYLSDAPSDSTQYARYNGAWSRVIATSLGTLFAYNFGLTTTAPPASGTIRVNNVNQTLATTIWLHYTNGSGVDMKNYFANRVKVGDTFYLQDKDDATRWQLYELTGAFTDSGTYATLPVTWRAGGSSMLAQAIVVSREAAGGVPPVDDVIGGIITISNTAPSIPAVNDVWIDTT